jgi:hypothetical protein
VTKKVVRSRSERARPEPYAKGYAHRLVVIPTFVSVAMKKSPVMAS